MNLLCSFTVPLKSAWASSAVPQPIGLPDLVLSVETVLPSTLTVWVVLPEDSSYLSVVGVSHIDIFF